MFRKPLGSQRASLVAQVVKDICLQCWRCEFDPWVGKIPNNMGRFQCRHDWAAEHTQGLVSRCLFPLKLHFTLYPPTHPYLAHRTLLRCLKRLLSQERGLIWGPQHQETWSLGYFLKLKASRSGNHPLVELGRLVAARQHRLRGGSIQDSQHGCSVPLQASHGIQGCPVSRDGRAAQVREVGGN